MMALRGFPLFASLPDGDLQLLERILVEQTVPSGHVFMREGDHATAVTAAMYVLLEGTVRVSARAPDGGFGVQRRLEPGHVFGTVALIADVPRTATCTAEGRVRVARLDRLTFQELFRKHRAFYARFQLLIARGLAADVRALRAAMLASLASGDLGALRDGVGR